MGISQQSCMYKVVFICHDDPIQRLTDEQMQMASGCCVHPLQGVEKEPDEATADIYSFPVVIGLSWFCREEYIRVRFTHIKCHIWGAVEKGHWNLLWTIILVLVRTCVTVAE